MIAKLKKKSSRHHYIPQFYLDGFKNPNGLLYIFDKNKNRILNKPRPTKSIFFERDRNTVELTETLKSSFIEDELYSKIDSQASKTIKYFQNEVLREINFDNENTSQFLFFLITMFWRIPVTDIASEELMDKSILTFSGIDPKQLKNDSTYRKIQRAFLFKHHIDEIVKNGKKGKDWINIHQSPDEVYIIGDNPLLFRKTPANFSEFNDNDFIVAVSSNRLYSSTKNKLDNFPRGNSIKYNAAIIHQSIQYVASGNKTYLENSIQYYNEIKNRRLLPDLIKSTFKTN